MKKILILLGPISSLVLMVIDEVSPIKQVRLKQRTEPWFNSEIFDKIHRRDKALYQYKRDKTNELKTIYNKFRNETQKCIHNAKRDYIKGQLEENKGCIKKVWKTLKSIGIPSKHRASSSNIGLKDRNESEINFDKQYVSNKFNNFFCSIASELVNKLPKVTKFDSKCINEFYSNLGVKKDSFNFDLVSEDLILKKLLNINTSKATGHDLIDAKFVKDGGTEIVVPFTYIINLSINSATVPDDFKVAKVIPLYKKGDKNYEGNYRPVSVLPTLSKIFERIAYEQVSEYMKCNDLLYEYQSGFRETFSTDTAVINLTDTIRLNLDKGLHTGMVLIDLQKAFDTVNHSILLTKLEAIGMQPSAVSLIKSYLANRTQYVITGGVTSDTRNILCGVPQGSILGPLLFLIYVNDMKAALSCDLMLYADDSALIVTGKDVKDIEYRLSQEMQKCSDWLINNRLSLHLGKTEAILFSSKRAHSKLPPLNVMCNGIPIKQQTSVKYLGSIIDQTLSGLEMATNAIKKINAGIKFMYRKQGYLGYKERKQLCMSLLQSRFDYACNFWYRGLPQYAAKKLQCCQNKIVRFVLALSPRTHLVAAHFKKLNWLVVSARVDYLTLCHMFNCISGTAPKYLKIFNNIKCIHQHSTRYSELSVFVERVKSNGMATFKFNGAKLWNNLPLTIKSSPNKNVFKKKCRKHLQNEMAKKEANVFLT